VSAECVIVVSDFSGNNEEVGKAVTITLTLETAAADRSADRRITTTPGAPRGRPKQALGVRALHPVVDGDMNQTGGGE